MTRRTVIGAAALAFLAYAAGLVVAPPIFGPTRGEDVSRVFILALTAATLLATGFHVAGCVAARRGPPPLALVLVVAFTARVGLLFAAPPALLEGEPERTRLEGRLVNLEVHPYEFKPEELAPGLAGDARMDHARTAVASAEDVARPDRLARPDLRSTTPPVGHWAAALADWFKPHSDRGYAFLVLVADTIAIYFLILALHALRRPLAWVLVYAWCPVLLKEAYCNLAIDALLLPAMAAVVYCLASGRKFLMAVPIALCASFRPVLLLMAPVYARRLGLLGLVLLLALLAASVVPWVGEPVPAQSYLEAQVHVWRHHEYNSLVENIARSALSYVPTRAEKDLTVAGVPLVAAGEKLHVLLAKVFCAVLLVCVATYLSIRVGGGVLERSKTAALADLGVLLPAVLFLAPVLEPSMGLWLLPLLVLRPGLSWLCLPGLLCLSHLTHLNGPDAADLAIAGTRVSFRAVEFGLFGLLWIVDLVWRDSIFPDDDATLRRAGAPPSSESELTFSEFDEEGAAVPLRA